MAVARLILGTRVAGLEHVPTSGPVLVVANHAHNIDPVLLAAAYPRLLFVMAKIELFRNPLLARVLHLAGAFPVDRGKADRNAIRYATAVLAAGEPLAIFPEGSRSRSGRISPGQPGAGLLALGPDVLILPVGIIGSQRLPGGAGSNEGRSHRGLLIQFGMPFRLPAPTDGVRWTPRDATTAIMSAIEGLLPPEQQSSS